MGARSRRPCRFCQRWFRPDPRVGPRQYACSATECQARRQERNEAARLERDPAYWRHRAVKHRAYRRAHPEINRRWRERHVEAVSTTDSRAASATSQGGREARRRAQGDLAATR